MELISNGAVCPSKLSSGFWVWIPKDKADIISKGLPDRSSTLPFGKWCITTVKQNTLFGVFQDPTLVYHVEARHELWGNDKEPFFMVLMPSSGDILMVGSILIDKPLKLLVESVKQLDLINSGRSVCAVCNRKLNIVSTNLRFCTTCENTLNQ